MAGPPPAILGTVSAWGRTTYGDPCAQCGFHWAVSQEEAVAIVKATPAELARVLSGLDGRQRHDALTWPAVAYVAHVGDNLRIWAERLAGLASGDPGPVAPYDQDLLALARRYDQLALAGALWSLAGAARDWADAVRLADDAGVTLVHPDRGPQSVLDVVRSNAHDACHHCWDVRRTVEQAPGRLTAR